MTKIKKPKIPSLEYSNDLGTMNLTNVRVLLDEEDYVAFRKGKDLRDLDYGLTGSDILKAEKYIAKEFFKTKYRAIFEGEYQLSVEEIVAIQEFMGLNNQEFATILGIDKGSFSNIIKRGTMSRPVALLAIERLGLELSRPGSVKRLVDPRSTLGDVEDKVVKEINATRYGQRKKAA